MDSRDFLRAVKQQPERYFIVHYSSQSLYDDDQQGLSPRITSIVVRHLATGQTVSFAMHAVAEELGIARENIVQQYDRIEGELLERFYAFVRDRRVQNWVHWNMRNLVYGFEHIEHRYRALVHKDAPQIPVEVRINLNDVLKDRYGSDFAPDPRMINLMKMNGDLDQRFLDGKGEAEAFRNGQFIRMNSSTMSKVDFFAHVIRLMQVGKLRTAANSLGAWIDRLLESRAAKSVTLVSAAVAIPAAFVEFLLLLH